MDYQGRLYVAVCDNVFLLQVKGALEDVKPKGGFFDRINAEALTDNAPSVQFGK